MSEIQHGGIIKSITKNRLEVEIQTGSACHSCAVRGSCSLPDNSTRIIPVSPLPGKTYRLNEKVTVIMQESQGWLAVFMAFILPLLLVLAVLLSTLVLWQNETLAASASLLILAPYYLILYSFRHRLQKRFHFRLKEE